MQTEQAACATPPPGEDSAQHFFSTFVTEGDTMGISFKSLPWLRLYLMTAGCTLAACQPLADRSKADRAGLRSDSAGVTIVEHSLGPSDAAARVTARLDDQALFRVDSIPRAQNSELFQLGFVAFMDGGQLVVAHRSKKELLLFESDGSFLKSVGGDGSGPGEFRGVEGPWKLAGNHFGVADQGLGRITIYAWPDRIVRTISFAGNYPPGVPSTPFATYGITRTGTTIFWGALGIAATPGISRPEMSIVSLDSAGNGARVGPPRPGMEQYVAIDGQPGVTVMFNPMGPAPLVAACGDRVAIAENQSYQVNLTSTTGDVVMIVRADVPRHNATDSDYIEGSREYLEMVGRKSDNDILETARAMASSPFAPVLRNIRCEASGAFWVEEFPDYSGNRRRVVAYEPDGSMRHSLWLPLNMRILGVDGDRMALLVLDEDDVEHLEVRKVME